MARELRVDFKGDATDLTRAADQADRSLRDVDNTAEKVGGTGGGLAKWGAAAGVAAVGVGAAVAVAWQFAEAAGEDERSALALANVLKQTAGATDEQVAGAERWIAATSEAAAITDDELRPALQRLAGATQDTDRAQQLLQAALDISAGTGKDLGSVVEALTKAELGNVSGLGRLGLETEDFAGNQKDLAAILEDSKTKFGGLAEAAANSDSGGLAKANIAVGELQEQIGAYLLPVIGRLAKAFTEDVIPAIQTAIAWIEENWPKIQKAIAPVLEDVGRLISELATAIVAIFQGPLGTALLAIVEQTFGEMLKIIKPALALIVDLVRLVGAVLSGDWSKAWDAAGDVVGGMVDVVLGLVDALWSRFTFVFGALEDVITAPFEAALEFIQDLWDKTVGRLKLPSFLSSIPNPFGLAAAPSSTRSAPAMTATGSSGRGLAPSIVINLPAGTDPYATVNALRVAGARVGGLDLAALAVR